MSSIQSVLFDNKKYDEKSAKLWLKKHNLNPIKKVHKTEDKLRYRLAEPVSFKRFRTKKLKNNIELVLGFN